MVRMIDVILDNILPWSDAHDCGWSLDPKYKGGSCGCWNKSFWGSSLWHKWNETRKDPHRSPQNWLQNRTTNTRPNQPQYFRSDYTCSGVLFVILRYTPPIYIRLVLKMICADGTVHLQLDPTNAWRGWSVRCVDKSFWSGSRCWSN